MAQTILLFRINRDKYAVIQNVCRTLGIRIIDVARKDYSQKLGTLAQIQGFTREAKKYDGPEFPAEMLIFSEMNSDQKYIHLIRIHFRNADFFGNEFGSGGCISGRI